MADQTTRFGFNKFGGTVGGSIADDGGKFSLADRDMLDRLLAQVEQHTHRVPTLPQAPAGEASLLVLADAGDLEPDTYYYMFTVVDAAGMESLPSTEVSVSTPLPLDPPDEPGAWVDTPAPGLLPPGRYFYALTALRGDEESALGELVQVAFEAPDGAVTLDLPDYGEATDFRVWRQEVNDPGWTVVGTVSAPAAQFVDDGSVPADPCGEPPPRFFEGLVGYGITVGLPLEVDLSTATSWRLYRTDVEGQYASASLVHEVVEREDEFDTTSPLLRSWTDEGDDLMPGAPPALDQNMRFQPFTFERLSELPDVAAFPLDYPLLVEDRLYVRGESEWVVVAGGGGGGGGGVLTDPSGARWALSVDESGALTTSPTIQPGPPTPVTSLTVTEV